MASGTCERKRLRVKTTVLCHVDGDSSGDDDEVEAAASARGACGQFVWPCPREYPETFQARQQRKWFIPADYSKEDLGKLFKSLMTESGHGPSIVKIHVCRSNLSILFFSGAESTLTPHPFREEARG